MFSRGLLKSKRKAHIRFIRIFVLLTALALLIWYGRAFYPAINLQMCLANPEKYDGTTITVGNEATVKHVYKDGFSIVQLGNQVRVYSDDNAVASGEFVTLEAVFHKPNILRALQIKVAKKRRAKIWLSVGPVLLIVAYFFRRFRFNAKKFCFEERA
jgi:hypothetical protein